MALVYLLSFLSGIAALIYEVEWFQMLELVTGWKINSAELHDTARRIVHLRKLYNIRHGWTPDEDTLPERFLAEPLSEGASAGATLSRPHLQALIGEYNRQRGWSPEGWLSPVLIETVLPPIC